jgi:hypothetical protein
MNNRHTNLAHLFDRRTGFRHLSARCIAYSVVISLALVGAVSLAMAQDAGGAAPGLQTSLTGVVTLVWGDGGPGRPSSVGPTPVLVDGRGGAVELRFAPSLLESIGGVLRLNRRSVSVTGAWTTASSGRFSAAVAVTSLRFLEGGIGAPEAVTGSQPWVSIMCKFSDVATEPENLAFFQGMYASTYPGIDNFWRQVSYNIVNIVGSAAYGWFTLPHPRSYYIVNNSANLGELFSDCTGVADPTVNFAPFVGINMMFNDNLDCCAWGGSWYATLDGVNKSWRVTWEPPWGYANSSVIAHEMGHGFGLPHSSFDRNVVYDNCWDVMSDTWDCALYDSTYGDLGQHTISYHKDLLGWYRGPEKLTVGSSQSTSVTLERSATPGWPIAKMVEVPIGGSSSHFYTIEARRKVAYDGNLPGNAIVVHEVDTSQSIPAVVKGTNGKAGAVWGVGSLFRDDTNGIGMTVTGAAANGYTVAVANGTPLAASFPVVDAHAASGTSSNLNGVLEPGETVRVEPAWTDVSTGSVTATGSAISFNGPSGATYSTVDGSASYGTIASTATSSCQGSGDCYIVSVSSPPARPALHWDATLTESLSSGGTKQWVVHIGNSFTDVPPGAFAYRFIETLLHEGLTAGCGNGMYCPGQSITRWQMAVFLAAAMAGANVPASGTVEGMGSYNCMSGGNSLFADVLPTDSGCKFIHYLLAKGITAGCGGGNYCPSDAVTRWQMAVFLAAAMAGNYVPSSGTVPSMGSYNCEPSGGTSVFADVAPNDPGCKFIHYIAATGVTAGCNPGYYCPAQDLHRDQMAVFVTTAFGYSLYGP